MKNPLRDIRLFQQLSRKYNSPRLVQKYLRQLAYNSELEGETCRSAFGAWYHQAAHCLEASLLAAAILEPHGFEPLVLSLESADDLDHVLFAFKQKTGWGAIGRSRDEGLHGRAPRFRSVRDLAWSYFDHYIDKSGRITAYQIASLANIKADWRFSNRNVWAVEDYLIDLKHKKIISSDKRYSKYFNKYKKEGPLKVRRGFW